MLCYSNSGKLEQKGSSRTRSPLLCRARVKLFCSLKVFLQTNTELNGGFPVLKKGIAEIA